MNLETAERMVNIVAVAIGVKNIDDRYVEKDIVKSTTQVQKVEIKSEMLVLEAIERNLVTHK